MSQPFTIISETIPLRGLKVSAATLSDGETFNCYCDDSADGDALRDEVLAKLYEIVGTRNFSEAHIRRGPILLRVEVTSNYEGPDPFVMFPQIDLPEVLAG